MLFLLLWFLYLVSPTTIPVTATGVLVLSLPPEKFDAILDAIFEDDEISRIPYCSEYGGTVSAPFPGATLPDEL